MFLIKHFENLIIHHLSCVWAKSYRFAVFKKKICRGWGFSSVVEHLPSERKKKNLPTTFKVWFRSVSEHRSHQRLSPAKLCCRGGVSRLDLKRCGFTTFKMILVLGSTESWQFKFPMGHLFEAHFPRFGGCMFWSFSPIITNIISWGLSKETLLKF